MAVNYEYKKNYYELLDVSPGSSGEEIERAYRRAAEAYSADSAALYSLCSEEQREGLLSEIRAAFETLTDPLKKREYDSKLNGGDHEEQEMSYEVDLRVLGEGAVRPEEKHPGPAPELIKPWNTAHLKRPLVITDEKEPFTIEQYRVLYTKLESISLRHSYKVFAVTSAVKGEGKTVTSLHLAHVLFPRPRKLLRVGGCAQGGGRSQGRNLKGGRLEPLSSPGREEDGQLDGTLQLQTYENHRGEAKGEF